VCYAHQNERSGGYASGTIKCAEPVKEALGDILLKNHQIQARISRSAARMNVYRDIQSRHGRKPLLQPDPANETRWQSVVDEVSRSVKIQGDISETNTILLGPNGEDRCLLTADEIANNDLTRLLHTSRDKMIMHQFDCAATPAKVFCKFTQDTRETWSYVLFEARHTIAQSRNPTFTMYPG
jgi:hypothetical protein